MYACLARRAWRACGRASCAEARALGPCCTVIRVRCSRRLAAECATRVAGRGRREMKPLPPITDASTPPKTPGGTSSKEQHIAPEKGGGGGKRKRDGREDESTEVIMPKHGGAYTKEIRTFEHKWLYEDRLCAPLRPPPSEFSERAAALTSRRLLPVQSPSLIPRRDFSATRPHARRL